MKLISCHIENFGKLSDLDIDFSGNSNVINQDNGWGKSTLVTFIKVMFFGFSNEKAKKIVDNDRKKFRPWQGGIYGGRITFESGGKKYELYRVFGTKSSEDTFSLKNADTNLDSYDFTENIGEELFKIDGESFLRTACISQNDCATGVTDKINSKLGNLTDNTDDINNYEKVVKLLDNMKNKLSPTRKTGEIYKMTEQIHTIQSGISSEEEIELAISKNKKLLENEKVKRESCKKELISVQNRIEAISRNKEMLTKLESYEKLCRNCDEKNNELASLKTYFKNDIPKEDELSEIIEAGEGLTVLRTKMDNSVLNVEENGKLDSLKRFFSKRLPTENEITQYKVKSEKLNKLKLCIASEGLTISEEKELEYLNNKFSRALKSDVRQELFDKNIRDWNIRNEIKSGLGLKKASLASFKLDNEANENKQNDLNTNGNSGLFLLSGIIFIILGLVLFFVESIGVVVPIISILVGVVGIALYFTSAKKNKFVIEEQQKVNKEKSDSIFKYQQEIEEDEKQVLETESRVKTFIEEFGEYYSETEVLNCLYNLKGLFVKYNELCDKKQSYNLKGYESECEKINADIVVFLGRYFSEQEIEEENYSKLLQQIEIYTRDFELLNGRSLTYVSTKEKYDKAISYVKDYIKNLGIEPEENLTKQLGEINIALKDYLRIREEFNNLIKEKELFEEKNDVAEIKSATQKVNTESVEELKEVQTEINERLEQISDNIHHYQNIIDSYSKQQQEILEDTGLLEQLKEEKERLTKRLTIAEYTRNYLQKAKENLTSKYMNPIMESFKKYYKILTKQESDNCKIDAKINIKVMEKGEQRDTEFLSTGYQDLIGICMRMALVDAMYEDEKPFLIFDDPFVNLDETKVLGGIELLKEISKEYQIIYLTCHESRSFKNG